MSGIVMDFFLVTFKVLIDNWSNSGFYFLLESFLIYFKLIGSLLTEGLWDDMKKFILTNNYVASLNSKDYYTRF